MTNKETQLLVIFLFLSLITRATKEINLIKDTQEGFKNFLLKNLIDDWY